MRAPNRTPRRPLALVAVLALGCSSPAAQDAQPEKPAAPPSSAPLRIACIGDSITIGGGKQSYPAQLGRLLGTRYEVRNFGVSGATMLQKGNKPYRSQKAWRNALAYQRSVNVPAAQRPWQTSLFQTIDHKRL